MKKFLVQFVFLIIVIGVALFFFAPGSSQQNFQIPFIPQRTTLTTLDIGSNKFKIELADTQEKRSKGLGGREKLASDEGMLFIFPDTKKHSFWMKGLKFPLDFIWIKGNSVVDIIKDVPLPGEGQKDEDLPIYLPIVEVDKVLEVNAQTVDRLGISVGDIITISDIPN